MQLDQEGLKTKAAEITNVSACLRLTLPMPPSINEQYATVDGHRVSTAVAKRFKKRVKEKLMELRLRGVLSEELLERFQTGYLTFFLQFYFTSPLRRDLDGGLKITLDAVTEPLGINDNRVVNIQLLKYIDPLHERIELEVEALREWQFDEEYVVLSS
jgi:crossover junction endodeoxyribonuclease RusA